MAKIRFNQLTESEQILATLAFDGFSKVPPINENLLPTYFEINRGINQIDRKTLTPYFYSLYHTYYPNSTPLNFFCEEIMVFTTAIDKLKTIADPSAKKLSVVFEDYVSHLSEQLYFYSKQKNDGQHTRKIRSRLGKSELISLFLILKDRSILEFKNDNHLSSFLETNFLYMNNTPLQNTITEISKIRGLNRNKDLCETKVKFLMGDFRIKCKDDLKNEHSRTYVPKVRI